MSKNNRLSYDIRRGLSSEKDDRLADAAPALYEACKAAIGTFHRQLKSEGAVGSPFCGDDEHESIGLLEKALALADRGQDGGGE